ncbi:MAG: RiPP maturation radical SAM C-methyltransferase [Deltaproteobacteria bacterium]|nr:RiPP maturation radical SAM C-methyltransferase [Deltaproteobacteria bacterium]
MPSIALVSTPWPLFNRPSIQLGSLKAYIGRHLPGVRVRSHHVYLSVADALGYDTYRTISERTWLSESLYAGLLYPERRDDMERLWRRQSVGLGLRDDFRNLSNAVEHASKRCLDSFPWDRCLLAGLSICFGQLTSSLYFAREIKQRAPEIRIVAGGSACAADMGLALLKAFTDIDYVIRGEGEMPLLRLASSLLKRGADSPTDPVPGLIYRGLQAPSDGAVSQLDRMDDLPIPDYGDYFALLDSFPPEKTFLPKIPMEISRGCWWRKPDPSGKASGCAFCNLNLQWRGYRTKSPDRVVKEISALVDRHHVLSISFMDNLLPAKRPAALFEDIRRLGKDLRLFSEIRATTPRNVLAAMGSAGMREVQVGIEALSTSLLKKLNKGTTAMDNMEIMKHCETPGMPNLTGNLILTFPSSDDSDVTETLHNLEFALPFRPLKAISFWLGYGSAVWQMPAAYGIERIRNHAYYDHLFPSSVVGKLQLMIQGYRGGVRVQHRLWKPVRHKVDAWGNDYRRLHRAPYSDPILGYEEGGDFIVIRQRRADGDDMTHRLRDTSRSIYLFCETQQPLGRILEQFPAFGEDRVLPFLEMMVDKRLMFREGDRFLSLAVPLRVGRPPPIH